jgi:hypothetical protein
MDEDTDGSCVGIIGADGRCSECGRAAGTGSASLAADPAADADAPAAPSASSVRAPTGETGGGFDPNRRLCEDGACTGVIGADGVCHVCGRVAGS